MNYKKTLSSIIYFLPLGLFIILGVNVLINYGFWYFKLYNPGPQGENWDVLPTFLQFLQDPNFVFRKWGGQITAVSKIFMYLDYAFFHGSNIVSLLRQTAIGILELFLFYKVLLHSPLKVSIRWICLIVILILISNPIVWYANTSTHEGWIDMYFLFFITLYFFIQSYQGKKSHRLFYFIWTLVFSVLTSFSFGSGLLVFPVLIILTFLSKQYKKFLILFIMFFPMKWLFWHFGGANLGHLPLHLAWTSWAFWKTIIFSFAEPAGYFGYHNAFYWVFSLPRALIVITLIAWFLYVVFIRPLFKLKAPSVIKFNLIQMFYPYLPNLWKRFFLKIDFKAPLVINWLAKVIFYPYLKRPWIIFFMGILIFSIVNVFLISITRYYYVEMHSGYLLSDRFQYNALIMMIPVVVLTFYLLRKSKKRTWQFSLIVCFYSVWVINVGRHYFGAHYSDNIHKVQQNILMAMDAYTPKYSQQLDYFPHNNFYALLTWSRLWNIGGYALPENSLMGISLKTYIQNKYFQIEPPCNGDVHKNDDSLTWGQGKRSYASIEEKGQTSLGNQTILHTSSKPFKTIAVSGIWIGTAPHSTLLVTDPKGIVVGLGFLSYYHYRYAGIWNIASLLAQRKWQVYAVIKLPIHQSNTYTIWILKRDRFHICKMATLQAP